MHIERSGFFEKLDTISGFTMVNLLWVIGSLPIVTIPACTAGLFNVMVGWVRGQQIEPFHRFFGGIRQFWWKSTLIGLVDLLLGSLVVVNLSIFPQMDAPMPLLTASFSIVVLVGIILAGANLYIWVLLVTFDLPLYDLGSISVKLVFKHPLWTLMLLAMLLGMGLLVWILPAILILFALISASTWLVSWGAWRIIRQYEDQLNTQ